MDREAEIAENLARVQAQVATAVRDAGRDRSEITLIAVTKNFPVRDIEILYNLGVRDFGENREQEAREKVEYFATAQKSKFKDIRWHYQGQLQRNKLASIGSWANLVHSVDDQKYLQGLSDSAIKHERIVECLIQISLEEDSQVERTGSVGRGGINVAGARELLTYLQIEQSAGRLSGICLTGVMGVAPLEAQPESAFARLQKVFYELNALSPAITKISAGMSGDFIPALACGATHLRIGSSILGSRTSGV